MEHLCQHIFEADWPKHDGRQIMTQIDRLANRSTCSRQLAIGLSKVFPHAEIVGSDAHNDVWWARQGLLAVAVADSV